MSDVNDIKGKLLSAVQRPAKKAEPSNIALWLMFGFFNLVALTLDGITAWTVANSTKFIAYGVVAFLAGFIPFALHEAGYVRAYASKGQRTITVIGALLAVLSMVTVAIMVANINTAGGYVTPFAVLVVIIVIALFHGLLAAFYFYNDSGILAAHTKADTIAFHKEELEKLEMANEILAAVEKGVILETQIGSKYDQAALSEVMRQLRGNVSYKSNGRSNVPQNGQKQGQGAISSGQAGGNSNNPQHTLDEFLAKQGLTASKAKDQFKTFEDFAKIASGSFDYISGGNMRRMYAELNPTKAGQNGRH